MKGSIGWLCFLAGACAPSADLIVTRGAIWTVNDSEPEAQGLGVIGGRIVYRRTP